MQIVSIGDSLPEMLNLFSHKHKKHIPKCHLLKFLLGLLSIKEHQFPTITPRPHPNKMKYSRQQHYAST